MTTRSRAAADGGPDDIELGFDHLDTHVNLASFDDRYLSPEVAGGFTGRAIGIQASARTVTVGEFGCGTVG